MCLTEIPFFQTIKIEGGSLALNCGFLNCSIGKYGYFVFFELLTHKMYEKNTNMNAD